MMACCNLSPHIWGDPIERPYFSCEFDSTPFYFYFSSPLLQHFRVKLVEIEEKPKGAHFILF